MNNLAQFHASKSQDIMFPVVEREMYWKDSKGEMRESAHKMLLRVGERKEGAPPEPIPLAVVGKDYKVVTNQEVRDALDPIISKYNVLEMHYTDYKGKKCYLDFIFRDVSSALSGHSINFRAIFWNGYGGASFGCKVGAINFFCLNGMIHGEYEGNYRRHTSGLDMSIAQEWIEKGLTHHRVVQDKWLTWANREIPGGVSELQLTERAWLEMSDNKKHIAKMDDVYNDKYVPIYGRTYFSLYQTLTDFASHQEDYKLRAVNNNAPHTRELELLAKAEKVMARLAA